MIENFIKWNIGISSRATPRIASSNMAYQRYYEVGSALLREMKDSTVLDIGAGKTWPFPVNLKQESNLYLVGFDIDDSEMKENSLLDMRSCGDACSSLSIEDGSVDLIMLRAAVEHLHDTAGCIRNCYRALRPGGKIIAAFANRYAPFAILNRLLPRRLTGFLLKHLVPGSDGELGFKAYYNRCSFTAFKADLLSSGFDVDDVYCSYFSSEYFKFFFPLYLLSLCLDYARYFTRAPNLASHYCFIATKPI